MDCQYSLLYCKVSFQCKLSIFHSFFYPLLIWLCIKDGISFWNMEHSGMVISATFITGVRCQKTWNGHIFFIVKITFVTEIYIEKIIPLKLLNFAFSCLLDVFSRYFLGPRNIPICILYNYKMSKVKFRIFVLIGCIFVLFFGSQN